MIKKCIGVPLTIVIVMLASVAHIRFIYTATARQYFAESLTARPLAYHTSPSRISLSRNIYWVILRLRRLDEPLICRRQLCQVANKARLMLPARLSSVTYARVLPRCRSQQEAGLLLSTACFWATASITNTYRHRSMHFQVYVVGSLPLHSKCSWDWIRYFKSLMLMILYFSDSLYFRRLIFITRHAAQSRIMRAILCDSPHIAGRATVAILCRRRWSLSRLHAGADNTFESI